MERIPSIVRLSPEFPMWKADPFHPVDWRAQDAERLLAGSSARWAGAHDPDVEEYARYMRSLSAGEATATQALSASRQAVVSAAHQLAQQDDPVRWLVEAAILAGESDEQVAARCGLDPSVIATFERLFFAVRDSLKAEVWVLTQVIGRVWQGFHDDELNRLWRGFAYFGGPLILDTLATHFFQSWQPGEPPTISVYFAERSTAPLELQTAIATYAVPVNEVTGLAFMRIHAKLMEIEKTMAGTGAKAAKDELRRETIRLWQSGPAPLRKPAPLPSERPPQMPVSQTDQITTVTPDANHGIDISRTSG